MKSASSRSKADGFHHPASLVMRGLASRDGAPAWLVPTLIPDIVVPMKLFLMDGRRRGAPPERWSGLWQGSSADPHRQHS